jgi:uncharacterized protein
LIVLADTSFIVAVSIRTDRRHTECAAIYQQHPEILIPESALAEIAFMLTRAGGVHAITHFLQSLPNAKRYKIVHLINQDYDRTAEVLDKYANLRLDFVDAAIVALAERLNITRILTLDQRDFQILRPNHTQHFEILP